MAKVIKHNITYNSAPSTATLLPYDNRDSGLSATTTKGAIDELADEKADKTEVPDNLQDLDNVTISSVTSGQILKYNGSNWVNADESTGSSSFADLTDVDLSNLQNGQVAKYNSTTQKWENANESGGSTVSVTQIQSTGTKIATISVDSVDTDLYAPNGGGSGGHTIVDDAGTDLTQRTNLQFKGAYTEDNSTDDTTEVNVVREMTKAEFDLLSDDEKVGFINITDEIGGGLKYVKEVLWENLDESNMTILSNGSTISLSDNIFNYDEVYFEGCFLETTNTAGKKITHLAVTKVLKETIELAKSKYGSGQYEGMFDVAHNPIVSGGNYDSVYCLKVPDDNSLTVAFKYVGGWNANLCTMTRIIGIKYLSETENTYSIDEQIVGKWIDGSTLYEKTYVFQNVSSSVNAWTTLSTLTGIAKVVDIEGFMDYHREVRTFGIGMYLNVSFANGVLQYYTKELASGTCDITVTIRYTKSS